MRMLPFIALLATPMLADTAELRAIASGLGQRAEQGGYAAGIAACLLGYGDAAATRTLFTDAGWTAEVDGELGLIYLAADTGDFGGMLAGDGSFCEIASESIGTGPVMDAVVPVLMASSPQAATVTNDTGCTAFCRFRASVSMSCRPAMTRAARRPRPAPYG